jgi:hypothetical protein
MRALRLEAWTTIERTDEYHSGPPQIDIRLTLPDLDVRMAGSVMINICNALTNLCTLSVYDTDHSKATWISALGHLTSLRTVHVRASLGFVSALSIGSEGTGNNIKEIFLPGLHNLWIERTKFERVKDMDLFEELRDCLMNRSHWNVEVRELHLPDCGLYRDQVELFVVDVVGDGVEREESSDEDEDEW